MRKLIINIGQEAVVGVVYETSGKSKTLRRVLELPCFDYYNNHGRLDIVRIVNGINKLLPKDAKGLDIDLILPSYATDVKYIDAVDDIEKEDKKETVKRFDEKTVFIGESQTRKINQVITYSNKEITNIVSAFHREKLNVVRAISSATCYHNYMALFNQSDSYGGMDFKTHIAMVWGASKVTYIIMLGNLPVEARTSEYSLTKVYEDISTMGCEIPFYQALKAMNNFTLSTDPDTGILLESRSSMITEGSRVIELNDSVIGIIKEAFFDYLTNMVQEVRNIYDYTRDRYSAPNANICTNSKLLDECLCKTYTESFPIEYFGSASKIEIYDNKFQLKSIEELNEKYVPIIGCVIEGIKKGSDFYDN